VNEQSAISCQRTASSNQQSAISDQLSADSQWQEAVMKDFRKVKV
jgi:hypothetical protein